SLGALGLGALARGDAPERLLARAVDREHPVQAGDLEDLRDVLVRADERQRAARRPQSFDAADQDSERRRVVEGRLREADNQVLLAVLDHLYEGFLDLRRLLEVDLA